MTCCAVSTVSGVPSGGGGGGGGEANTGANVGGATGQVFRNKTGVTLNFKTISGSGGIVITDNADTIDIDGSGAGGAAAWSAVLAVGNTSGGTDAEMTHGDTIVGEDGGGGGLGIGGTLALQGGASTADEPGGPVNITGGENPNAGSNPGGAVNIQGGDPSVGSGDAGAVNITGGVGTGSSNVGGDVNIFSGDGNLQPAGVVTVQGGEAPTGADAGNVEIRGGGQPHVQGGRGGEIIVEGARSAVSGADIFVRAGDSGNGNRPSGAIGIKSGDLLDALGTVGDVVVETGNVSGLGVTNNQGNLILRVNAQGLGTNQAGELQLIGGDSSDTAGINNAGAIRATTGTAVAGGAGGDFIIELSEGPARSGRLQLTRPDAGPAIEIRYTPTDYDPEGVEFGSPGDIVNRNNGTAFIKETGTGTNTGWSRLSTASGGGAPALADVLAAGNESGGSDIVMDLGDEIRTADAAGAASLTLRAGNSTGAFVGGNVGIFSGDSQTDGNDAGSIGLHPGDATVGNADGGGVVINVGTGNGTGVDGNINLNGNTTFSSAAILLPTADGNNGQVMTTDGSAVMTFKTIRAQLVYTVVGTLTVNTDQAFALRPSQTLVIEEVFIEVKTAPTGASIIVDVNKNGTSIFNATPANRPSIAAAATTGTSGAPDTTSLAKDDSITIDIDQIGSGTAGADLTVCVRCALIPDA